MKMSIIRNIAYRRSLLPCLKMMFFTVKKAF